MALSTPPDDLREALGDLPPDERASLERIWRDLGDLATPAAPTDAAWHALRARIDPPSGPGAADRPAIRPSRHAWRRRGMVLSGMTALALAVLWFTVPVTHTAGPGETLAVALPDGSTAVLNSGAALRHSRRFGGTRAVSLHGEAYFDVVRGATPFVVATPDARVEVLGTAFNVRASDPGETSVALVHGRVRVTAIEAPDVETVLDPGQAVVVANGAVAAPATADIARVSGWREGALAFDDRPLDSVLAEVGRRYGVAIESAPGTPLDARLSAYYAERPALDLLLGDLGAAAGVRFTPESGGYVVRPARGEATPGSANRSMRAAP